MHIVNKRTLKYTIINGNFNNEKNITDKIRTNILTANAFLYDEYINVSFLNNLPLRPSGMYKIKLDEFYERRTKEVNRLIVELAYRYGHVVHLKGLSHLFFEDFYPSLQYVKSHDIETKTINLNMAVPELLLN
jgi:uroporphyrin-III C-methyltransferase